MYLFYEVCGEEKGKELGVPKPNLNEYELKQLEKLKRWIYEKGRKGSGEAKTPLNEKKLAQKRLEDFFRGEA